MFAAGAFPADGPLDRQWRRVRAPKGKEPMKCILLTPKMIVLFIHWDTLAKRGVPCVADRCWYCTHHVERRPRGYLSAVNTITKEWFVVEIPEGAASAMERDPRFGGDYRGWEVTFRRFKENPNAPVHYESHHKLKPEMVPLSFDPMPHIVRLYQDLVASGRLLSQVERPRDEDIAS